MKRVALSKIRILIVAQLTKYLNKYIKTSLWCFKKYIYQLQGKLGRIYQKNEEDVITYANRVKILGKQIKF